MPIDLTKIKADLATLSAAVLTSLTDVQASLGGLQAQIATLQAQLAAGSGIAQSDVDALDATVTGISGNVATIITDLGKVTPPGPPTS